MTNHRSAITGKFVTDEHAAANLDTTVSESPCTECERLRGIIHAQKVAIDGYREEVERLRDELPIVRTVGDLTARHLGREVSVEGMRRSVLLAMRQPVPDEPLVALLVRVDGDITSTDYLPLEEPCEVLP